MLYRPLKANGGTESITELDQRIVGLQPDDLKERMRADAPNPIHAVVGVASGEKRQWLCMQRAWEVL